jgi:hypothetical protein
VIALVPKGNFTAKTRAHDQSLVLITYSFFTTPLKEIAYELQICRAGSVTALFDPDHNTRIVRAGYR